MDSFDSFDSFTLAPVSAGDIIDRAVRLYKRNFLTLVRIVLAPSLMAYLGSILFFIGLRNFSLVRGDARVALTTGLVVIGGLLWIVGQAAFYAVLGGSSRALVAHFFDGKPILMREVYASVRERIWSLIGATLMIAVMIAAVSWLLLMLIAIVVLILGIVANKLISSAPEWVMAVYGIISFLGTAGLVVLSFLLVYSRVVYVPQILMVEKKGVFSAISRSFQLASGELIRIGTVIIFWIYVAWSIWVLMAIPLGWYAYAAGVDITPFNPNAPVWYEIAKQTLTQLSGILIWPIAMLCFTLLYINSRVRKEGYDVELLANRVLAPPPSIPRPSPVFQQPASANVPVSPPPPSILGLSDFTPVPPIATQATVEFSDAAAVPANAATMTALLVEEPVEVSATSFQPVNLEKCVEPALSETAPAHSAAGAVSKACRWCGIEAGVEDRFCRVCGSVF